MPRVLLINPPSPEQLGSPLLGQQYVAAALMARGCEVRVIDAAARYFDHDADWIVSEAKHFNPDIIGFGLFTRWVQHAYRLAEQLRYGRWLLVAGGAHATIRAAETLEHGFDIAIEGEAENTLVKVVDSLQDRDSLASIPGVVCRGRDGKLQCTPAQPIINLDDLQLPQETQSLYPREWYDPAGSEMISGGILTSRGCPGRCTFCANYVTGRSLRYRSPGNIIAELNFYHSKYGTTFFHCWDDALTANTRRIYELCVAIDRGIRFPLRWSAMTRANGIRPKLLKALKHAGLGSIIFGVESGDNETLRAIRKGITTDHVLRALEWAKAEGLTTICNFMLGFPEETPAALERTLRFMQQIEPMVDSFSTLGVVIPFPGTPLYDRNHLRYGFTDWWLKEESSHYSPPPPLSDLDSFYNHYIDDANLDLNFFNYSDEIQSLIRACLKFKAEHNLHCMGLQENPSAVNSIKS
jgi:anaerobic magnesium-protoporphyrin IX monomethyl ester cyclase